MTHTGFCWETLKARGHLEDIRVDGKITFERHFKAFGPEDMDWIQLGQNREKWQAHMTMVIEPPFSTKSREFLDKTIEPAACQERLHFMALVPYFSKIFKHYCCCSYGRWWRSYLVIALASQSSSTMFLSTRRSVSSLGQRSRCSSSVVEFHGEVWHLSNCALTRFIYANFS